MSAKITRVLTSAEFMEMNENGRRDGFYNTDRRIFLPD